MNYKTTLMLVLLLALVGGYFYFVEFGKISGYEAHERAAQQADQPEGEPVFADLTGKADAVKRIDVVRGDQSFTVMKEGDRWFQTEPVRFPLNEYTPQAVARQFAELRYLQRLTPGGADAPTLEQMGLDQPRAVVTVWVDDKAKSLRLGKVTLGGNGYVRVEGETDAYIVDAALFGSVLDAAVTDWRGTSLDVPQASGAGRINHTYPGGEDVAVHKVDGRWRFDSESVDRINADAIDEWFSAIGRLWINEFVIDNPDNLGLYGLEEPYLRIKLYESAEDDKETVHTLHIGNTDLSGEHRYAAWTAGDEPASVIFNVNAASAEALAKTHADLRDPKVIAANAADVRGLTVQQSGQTTLNLIRDPQQGYSFGEPDPGFRADYSTAHGLVTKLCELNSERQMPAGEVTGDPIATVRLTLAGDDEGLGFAIYDRGEDRVIVSDSESVGYLVAAGELDTLLGPPLGLRDRTVLDIEPGSIARMTLRRDDGASFTFEPKPATEGEDNKTTVWRLAGHEAYEGDAIAALVKALNPLRAERWLAEPATVSAGWIEWGIEPVGGGPITVNVEPQSGAAVMSGAGPAFVLPKAMLARLTAEYRGRLVLDIAIDQIESVRLANNETDLTISREGQRYVSDTGEIAQPLAAAVFDTLAGLRARRYLPPMQLSPGDVTFTVEVTTADGEARTLRVFDDGGDTATVTIDPPQGGEHTGWFTLDRADVDRLRAPLGDVASPIK